MQVVYRRIKISSKRRRDLTPRPGVQVYRATLNQVGGAVAPVATILDNSLGPIVWHYEATGSYTAILSNAFPANKTAVFVGTAKDGGDLMACKRIDSNTVRLETSTNVGTPTDGLLQQIAFEIMVYP